jgi:ribosomal protein L7/L12
MPLTQDESNRITELSVRVGELERQLAFVYQHLQITYYDPNAPSAAMQSVKDWLRKGNKLEAIKLYRQLTHTDLSQAKAAVEAMERGER